jgi:hypothetical protein
MTEEARCAPSRNLTQEAGSSNLFIPFIHGQARAHGAEWRALAPVPSSVARRVPVSGWAAQSPAAGGRQRGV